MLEQNKTRVRAFLHQVLTLGDIEATGEFFHTDMVEEDPLPGQGPGLAGLKAVLTELRVAFPDMRWDVEEQLAESDRVMTRFVWFGTQKGAFFGIPPTHKEVSVYGIVIDRFVGPKIQSTRILMDTMGLMQQLGAIPGTPT